MRVKVSPLTDSFHYIPVISTKSLKSVMSSTTEVRTWILAVQFLLSWTRCSVHPASVGDCRTLTAADTSWGASRSMSLAVPLIACTPVGKQDRSDYYYSGQDGLLHQNDGIILLWWFSWVKLAQRKRHVSGQESPSIEYSQTSPYSRLYHMDTSALQTVHLVQKRQ